jgi:predicted DNA-binding transcriptional regulator YafY
MKINCREHVRIFTRVFWIQHQLQAKRFINATQIADHFEVSVKTAQRTLDYMRDELRLPLEYSAKHRGYHFTEDVHPFHAVSLAESDLVVILLAERLAHHYGGRLTPQIEATFAKIAASLTDKVSVSFSALNEVHSVERLPTSDFDPRIFTELGQAAQRRRRVEMDYFTQSRNELTTRRVNPLHLHNALGEWYLIAYDLKRATVLDFHLARIRRLATLEEGFEPPPDFEAAKHLASGFGMFRGAGDQTHEVVVEFDAYQAGWIRQQSQVHPSAVYENLADGGLRVTMRVGALEGVKMWILKYGAHVRVVAPAELRETIRREAEAVLALCRQAEK